MNLKKMTSIVPGSALNVTAEDDAYDDTFTENDNIINICQALNLRQVNRCGGVVECGLAGKISPNVLRGFRRWDLMSMEPRTAIDELRERFPLPRNATPPTGLKEWIHLPIKCKIPYLGLGGMNPQRFGFLYSRGQVGEGLTVPYLPNFTINEERRIQSDYSALHDPHSKNYFKAKGVRELLLKQGLISTMGEVKCTLREMNQYRQYLLEVTNSNVNYFIQQKAYEDCYQNSIYNLLSNDNDESHNAAARKEEESRGQILRMEHDLDKVIIREDRERSDAIRASHIEERKQREHIIRSEKALERNIREERTRARARDIEYETRARTLQRITTKELIGHLKEQQNSPSFKARSQGQLHLSYLEEKLRISELKKLQATAAENDDLYQKAYQRQLRIERRRELIPIWLNEQREKKLRLTAIVRKCFTIWLKKTRKAVESRQEAGPEHFSAFTGRSPNLVQQIQLDMHSLNRKELNTLISSVMKIRSRLRSQFPSAAASKAGLSAVADLQLEAASEAILKGKHSHHPIVMTLETVVEKIDDAVEEEAEEEAGEMELVEARIPLSSDTEINTPQ